MDVDPAKDVTSTDLVPLAALSPEERALVAGVNGQVPPDLAIDWMQVVHLAHVHGVGPLLHHAWSHPPAAIPPNVLTKLLAVRRQHAIRTLVGLRERDQVLRALAEADVPCLVLKGGALARRWYGDVSLRPLADIDLLVRPSDVDRARQILQTIGYRRGTKGGPSYHDPPLALPGSPSSVELHYELTNLPLLHAMDFDDLYARALILDDQNGLVCTLGPEDTLLHLCIHTLRHIDGEGGWTLLQLSDIARHVTVFHLDWEVFEQRSQEVGVQRGAAAVLGLSRLLSRSGVPEQYTDRTAAERLLPYMARQQVRQSYIDHYRALLAAEALDRMAWYEPVRMLFAWLVRPRPPQSPHAVAGSQAKRYRLQLLAREGWWLIRWCMIRRKSNPSLVDEGITFVIRQRQAAGLVSDLLKPD